MFYNTFLFMPTLPKLDTVVNPKFSFALAQRQYQLNTPHFVIADDVLSNDALDALLTLMLESTVFFETKSTYMGAYLADGFSHPILEQFVQELREGFPNIIGDLPLVNQWAYK